MQFFLSVYQLVRRNLKKKLLKSLDKILKCCIFASCLRFNKVTTKNRKAMENKKMTLEQFADLLNAVDPWEWELDEIFAIIVANDWTPIVDEWRLCHDGKNMIYFDDNGKAKITPIEE